MRVFEFEIPENLKGVEGVKEFISSTLTQHETFVKGAFEGFVSAKDVETKVAEALTEKKEASKAALGKRLETIKDLLPENLVDESGKQIIKLAGIKANDDDDAVRTKFAEAIETNKNLTNKSYTDFFNKKVGEEKPEKTQKEIEKEISDEMKFANL